MQFQSDILDTTIIRPQVHLFFFFSLFISLQITETTALGAAYSAGLTVGIYSSLDEIKSLWKEGKQYVDEG